jgi:radical SAM/Cys-rich protein
LPFALRAQEAGVGQYLNACGSLSTMQINVGALCNLQCKHCHIQAGPNRTEVMDRDVMEACLRVFARDGFTSIDITGGAPEMNPNYEWLIKEAAALARKAGGTCITRTNLAILTQPAYSHLPALWASLGVQVAASLPHWEAASANRQRGEGVFEQAIEGLRLLNREGYGNSDAAIISIVMNPNGAMLPPAQASAERDFRTHLQDSYGVTFTNLLTITNNPVGRFKSFLESRGVLDDYMKKLYDAFNPATVEAMMCRSQLSVDWRAQLYDCDFNQVLETPILLDSSGTCTINAASGSPATIFAAEENGIAPLCNRPIRIGGHCYACTAGAGSSCGGAIA